METQPEPVAIAETRLLHKMHRAATTLLADAAHRRDSPPEALAQLRDFLVAALRHHHESEDDVLWPQLAAADPATGGRFAELGTEHDELDEALDALAAAPVSEDEDRRRLTAAARRVRDLIHEHLEHEESLLFPALAAHMPDQAWADFSRTVISSAPPVAAHLNIGFFELVGTPGELAAVTAHLPQAALDGLPAMREQARVTLGSLRATDENGVIA